MVALTSEDRRLLSIRQAEAKLAGGSAAVYMYQFAWETDYLNGLVRAGHGLDTPFCFDNPGGRPTTGTRAGKLEMAATMSAAWIAFARNGNPNYEGLPEWPAYDTGRRATMILDVPPSVVDDPFGDERRAWDGIKVNLPFEGAAFVGSWGAE
jgi:para-nitrobenzyl esterase